MLIDPDQLFSDGSIRSESGASPQSTERESWLISFLDVLMVLVALMVLLLGYAGLQSEPDESATAVTQPEAALQQTHSFDLQSETRAFLDQLYIGDLKGQVDVELLPQQVKLGIHEDILFLAGDADLTLSGQRVLDELAHMLRERPWLVTVEGHTDNRPIATPRYPSNWELSSARASIVTRYLIHQGLTPDRLRAVGYADTRPRQSNATLEGRAQNRRVELVLTVPENS